METLLRHSQEFFLIKVFRLWKHIYANLAKIFFIELTKFNQSIFILLGFLLVSLILLALGWMCLLITIVLYLSQQGIPLIESMLAFALMQLLLGMVIFFFVQSKGKKLFPATREAVQTLMKSKVSS